MKKSTSNLTVILIVITLLKTFDSNGQIKSNQGIIYSFDYKTLNEISALNAIKDTITITRKKLSDIIILEFSQGGSGTSVMLYDFIRYQNNIGNPIEQEYAIKKSDSKSIMQGQNVLINITNLEDGVYLVLYSACNLGCNFPIKLKTETNN